MKIAIVGCTWKRPILGRAAFRSVLQAAARSPHTCRLFIAGSEGKHTERMAHELGAEYVDCDNAPLGAKFNASYRLARDWSPDYVLQWADDSGCSPDLFSVYARHLESGAPLIGLRDCWFDDDVAGLHYFSGYTDQARGPIGIGRLMSMDLLARMAWSPVDPMKPRGIDASILVRAQQAYGLGRNEWADVWGPHLVHLASCSEWVVNVRNETSITKLEDFPTTELHKVPPTTFTKDIRRWR